MMPVEEPESTSCGRQSLRPPMRGSRKRLKPRAPAARIAAHQGPSQRREKAISPTPMWTTLRASSPRVSAMVFPSSSASPHLAGLAQPGDGRGEALGKRPPAVAELRLRLRRAVGPVVLIDLDEAGGEPRGGAGQAGPGPPRGGGGLARR